MYLLTRKFSCAIYTILLCVLFIIMRFLNYIKNELSTNPNQFPDETGYIELSMPWAESYSLSHTLYIISGSFPRL